MKRAAFFLVLVMAGLVTTAYGAFQTFPRLQDEVFALGVRAQLLRASQLPRSKDALRVVLCGTSSPLPLRGTAKSCALVVAGDQLFLVDIGPEASENLALWRIPTPDVQSVFLTHFHSDHIGELGEFNTQGWVQGRRSPLEVFGPEGVAEVVDGFNAAYSFDRAYRHAHHDHGTGLLPLESARMQARTIPIGPAGDSPQGRTAVILERDGVRVTAIETDHRPVVPALSYRFDYLGRSVVITGDTVYYPPLAEAARGADVLISEAQSHRMQDIFAEEADGLGQASLASVLRDTSSYHIDPVEAAQLANEAGVRDLVYTHIAPPIVMPLLRTPWLRGVRDVRPEGVRIGHDGLMITIPADGGTIRYSRLRG